VDALRLARKAITHPASIPSAIGKRVAPPDPRIRFRDDAYLRMNARRLEHLASLGLPLERRSVLEVGAGICDLTGFFLDRECTVVTTEGRRSNVEVLRGRYPELDVRLLDMDSAPAGFDVDAEVVFCYGLLYHLALPAEALAFLAGRTRGLLLLETIVSPAEGSSISHVEERKHVASESIHGKGSRPTRTWLHDELGRYFPHVYCTRTQPWHPEFPVDWAQAQASPVATRAVFVAAREPITSVSLTNEIPERQERH
jgi:hypothetical protein